MYKTSMAIGTRTLSLSQRLEFCDPLHLNTEPGTNQSNPQNVNYPTSSTARCSIVSPIQAIFFVSESTPLLFLCPSFERLLSTYSQCPLVRLTHPLDVANFFSCAFTLRGYQSMVQHFDIGKS